MFTLDVAAEMMQEALAELDAARLDGREAARLTEVAALIQRFGATATMLCARRSTETNAWRRRSHAASPEQWLAETTGSSEGAAREAFATATRLTELPATEAQLRSGELSMQQAAQVTAGAIADPGAERRLLRTAKRSGMRELRAEKERVIAAVADELEARKVARRERHLRT